jgi:UDP-N-acetylmuramate: L-alanyl-gamma-D-glutamyl-meso-diaminopimelate ligase
MIERKKILFVRICGTGMSSLALICKNLKAEVKGVDLAYYPPVSTKLEEEGILCYKMDKLQSLVKEWIPDIVIVGNALNGKGDEAAFLLESGLKYYSMPSFIEEFLIPGKTSVVISGTHGKTTTTTMFSELLSSIGKDPSYIIGGIPEFSGTNASYTQGEGYFVIEGDEYDTAFFDKGPKFLHYSPDIAIITSIEFDHADIYDNLETIFENFRKLIDITRKKVVLCRDYENNRQLEKFVPPEKLITYSTKDKSADVFVEKTGRHGLLMSFCAHIKGNTHCFETPFFGDQNLMNLGALVSFLYLEEFEFNDKLATSFEKMKGIKRRQELIGMVNGGAVYSDFAHHPTAAELTFNSFREFFPEKEVYVVFDPATNSNNLNIFEQKYTEVFIKADKVVIGHPPKLDRIAEEKRFSPVRVVKTINIHSDEKKAFYIQYVDDIIDWIKENSNPNSVTVVMSNSGFNDFFTKIKSVLE